MKDQPEMLSLQIPSVYSGATGYDETNVALNYLNQNLSPDVSAYQQQQLNAQLGGQTYQLTPQDYQAYQQSGLAPVQDYQIASAQAYQQTGLAQGAVQDYQMGQSYQQTGLSQGAVQDYQIAAGQAYQQTGLVQGAVQDYQMGQSYQQSGQAAGSVQRYQVSHDYQHTSGAQVYQQAEAGGQVATGGVAGSQQIAYRQYEGSSEFGSQQQYRLASGATESSRVVRHEYGAERVISVTSRVDESRAHVVRETFVDHEIKVPKKIIREEIVERIVVIPEKIMREEIIEETQFVREKIVEVCKPTIIEKVIEIPEIEYIEKIVEVAERVVQEKLKHVEKIVQQERIQEVQKIIPQERVIEIPDIQYREVPYDRIVEIPDVREEIVYRDIRVPQYVDKPYPQYVSVEVPVDINRNIPVPVEAEIIHEYRLPRLRPVYRTITYPVYLPRFVEIPVSVDLIDNGLIAQAEAFLQQANLLTKSPASLCDIENLATNVIKADFQQQVSRIDMQAAIMKAWESNRIAPHRVGGPSV